MRAERHPVLGCIVKRDDIALSVREYILGLGFQSLVGGHSHVVYLASCAGAERDPILVK